jgi:hypothetical protein
VGMQVDPNSKCLVMNGNPGHLQFYNFKSDTQLYNVSFWVTVFVFVGGSMFSARYCWPQLCLINKNG